MTTEPYTILDNLPGPVILVTGGRRVCYANLAARALFDNIGLNADLALTIRHPQVLDSVDQALANGTTQTGEFSIAGAVPRVFDLHVTLTSTPPETNDDPAVLISLHEKTALVRAERMRADFVANASHELRSPLSAILGFIETLQGPAKEDADARERFLKIMDREAGRMNRLIDDLLSLSRVELDEHVRPSEQVNLVNTLGSVIDLLGKRAVSQNVEVEIIGTDEARHLTGDADQLFQALRNLIENAINHSPAGSKVRVTFEPVTALPDSGEPGLAVHIADQGKGIPKQHLPRLTERFYRVDPARSSDSANSPVSTGLGLAIVKHIVNRHRGRLLIESEPDKGSVFSILLPLS